MAGKNTGAKASKDGAEAPEKDPLLEEETVEETEEETEEESATEETQPEPPEVQPAPRPEPATKPAPKPSGQNGRPSTGGDIDRQYRTDVESTKARLAAQPKVKFFVPLEGQEKLGAFVPVQINGYRLNVPKGVFVEVPQQVAEILAEHLQIDLEAGKDFRIGDSHQKGAGVVDVLSQ